MNSIWNKIRPFLGNIRNEEAYKKAVDKLIEGFNNTDGLKSSEILESSSEFYVISNLLDKKILSIIDEGRSGWCLVDLDFSNKDPCFGSLSIGAKVNEYGHKMDLHASTDARVAELIASLLGSDSVSLRKRFLSDILNKSNRSLDKFNAIIDALKKEGIFLESNGYGRLGWRPAKARRYSLNSQFI